MNLVISVSHAYRGPNDVDAYIPELWAQESLAILEENMVAGLLVHRDFQEDLANFGEVVNTRKPGDFVAKRKGVDDDVTVQSATATNVPVTLNQHVHTSFLIRDGEESKSFRDLVDTYVEPAMIAQARHIDQVVLGQYPRFLTHSHGGLRELTGSNAKNRILGIRNVLNINKVPVGGRNLVWTPDGETAALNTDIFLTADKVGDDGTALREASLGRKLGLDHFMAQNMASVPVNVDTSTGTVGDGYDVGDTVISVSHTGTIAANSWVDIDGDPHRVVSSTDDGGNADSITIAAPGLRRSVANEDPFTVYTPGTVDNSGGYSKDYSQGIKVGDFTIFPKVGQAVSFGTDATSAVYTIIHVDEDADEITLDRPLEADVADEAPVNLGPSGDYNLAFHRNAIALVVRPLALPRAGTGALSAVINHNGLSMRATITYDGNKQGHLVTLDMLCGVAVLDNLLGGVLLG